MRLSSVTLSVILVLGGLAPALADDLNPPPWRGEPGTTFQQWVFSDSNPTPPPDLVDNPYGVPGAQVWPGTGQDWFDVWGGRQGVWPLSGAMEFYIPNAPPPNEYKDIWIQLTWAQQVTTSEPILSSDPAGTVELLDQVDIGPTGEPAPAGANWWHSTFNIRIYPNPDFETIRIDGTVMVDQVVIDTICAPEPASLGLLALGGLALLRRRRR
jgi:hypothetical protein